jgi:hypothetical protein
MYPSKPVRWSLYEKQTRVRIKADSRFSDKEGVIVSYFIDSEVNPHYNVKIEGERHTVVFPHSYLEKIENELQ